MSKGDPNIMNFFHQHLHCYLFISVVAIFFSRPIKIKYNYVFSIITHLNKLF